MAVFSLRPLLVRSDGVLTPLSPPRPTRPHSHAPTPTPTHARAPRTALYHYACPAIPANATTLPCGSTLPNATTPNCVLANKTVPYANERGKRPVREGYAKGNPQLDLVQGYPASEWCPNARFINAHGGHRPYDQLRALEEAVGVPSLPWATMLRRPKQRLLSAFGAGLHARMIGNEYNFAMYSLVETPLMFARVWGVTGCQTKTLLDRFCGERRVSSDRRDGLRQGDVAKAKRVLAEDFAFFGITDRWVREPAAAQGDARWVQAPPSNPSALTASCARAQVARIHRAVARRGRDVPPARAARRGAHGQPAHALERLRRARAARGGRRARAALR